MLSAMPANISHDVMKYYWLTSYGPCNVLRRQCGWSVNGSSLRR